MEGTRKGGLWPRLAPVRSGAASIPSSRQGSRGYRRFRCKYIDVRFRKVLLQNRGEIPVDSGAEPR